MSSYLSVAHCENELTAGIRLLFSERPSTRFVFSQCGETWIPGWAPLIGDGLCA
jgi:hypothetical protein